MRPARERHERPKTMKTAHDPCRIYAADLAAYNAGRLRGAWIDVAGKSGQDIGDEIDVMLARSPESNVLRRRCNDCGKHYDVDAIGAAADCPRCGSDDAGATFRSAEEYAIHDHEGFGRLISSESPDLEALGELAEALDDDDKRRGLFWLIEDRGCSLTEALERCEEVQIYESDADDLAADYAQELAADTIENFAERSSQWPFNCIDWKDAGRELTLGGDVDLYEGTEGRFLVTNAAEF